MKNHHVIIILLVLCIPFVIKAQEEEYNEDKIINAPRKKVGVVLSGGGAKGFAHIGVLKVLEEAGIPIDYIAGTSMGAVVGGLYSVGYSADMIDSLIQIQDWNHLMRDVVNRKHVPASQRSNHNRYVVSLPFNLPFGDKSGGVTLPPGVFTGKNIYNLFLNTTIGFQGEINFDDLPIPFGCVSADFFFQAEDGIRDRRAAGLQDARPAGRADRERLAVHEDRQGLRGVARARAR